MVLIEVQTGSYLKEDDIIRYEDVYARNSAVGTLCERDENAGGILQHVSG
jgi:hypothetical protein